MAQQQHHKKQLVQGIVLDHLRKPLEGATVFIENSPIYAVTDSKGSFKLYLKEGKHSLSCSFVGFTKQVIEIEVSAQTPSISFNLVLDKSTSLDEVEVSAKSLLQNVKESAYNVVAIDAQQMANTTADLADVLETASGVKIRRTGGVGSNASISLNGFSGRHVKIFMDGMPMQGFGSAFQINNIPVNLAERIEIYKGVVPIELGADALGGAINIVTNNKPQTNVDASYSYGSFNTHKSNVNVNYTGKSGFTFRLNAFQNYSDNNYKVKTYLLNLDTGVYSDEPQWFKRFHDRYHNETVIAKVGFVNKSWADLFLIGGTLGNEDNQVQNSALMKIAFGGVERNAKTRMATMQYRKKNVFIKHLDITANANYSSVKNNSLDTLARQYNWAGDYKTKSSSGEAAYTLSEFNNTSSTARFNAVYNPSKKHHFSLNNTWSKFVRNSDNATEVLDNTSSSASLDKISIKNVLGAAYNYRPNDIWNVSAFGKYYYVDVTGPVNVNGNDDPNHASYELYSTNYNVEGYGATASYLLAKDLQLKGSYEKTYRLPSQNELFGDELIEAGDASLKAEHSNNINANITYQRTFAKKHDFFITTGFIYRNTQDYIRRVIEERYGGAYYTNHGKVKTIGFDAELQYVFNKRLVIGGNATYQSVTNREKYTTNNTIALNYEDRMPNVPYLFGNGQVSYQLLNVFHNKKNRLQFQYNLNYTHEFFRYWESYGSSNSKITIPTQLSHDFSATLSLKNGMYNISLETQNFTNELLYDNYSLQKPGRSFAIKLRYYFIKTN
ncbi:TonB-dependent receptor [Pustulibacterium marinum]|nr:TonB-dependent receptor [Pustulibacterium marinum]